MTGDSDTPAGVTDRDTIYLGGAWVRPSTDARIPVENPATEQVIAHVPLAGAVDVDNAVAAARAAFTSWSTTTTAQRLGYLAELRGALAARQEELAAVITAEMGAPVRLSRTVHTNLPLQVLDGILAHLGDGGDDEPERLGNSLIRREPVGVVGAITPWNYPLHQPLAKIVPALAAGCTIVHKPSELAPLTAYLMAEIIESVGLPAGVYNLVPGTGQEAGEALVTHPDVDMISFTGSTRAGQRVAAAAAATVKRVALELGGKSANLLLPDADLATAVKVGVANCFMNAGQTCTALSRMLVPAARYDEAVELATGYAGRYQLGDPTDPQTRLGPVVSADQRERVTSLLQRALAEGTRAAIGGPRAGDLPKLGYYLAPTVLVDVEPSGTAAQEEFFGPVLSIISYADEDDAVSIANHSRYGLTGAVWSQDQDRAYAVAARLRTGQVDINGAKFNPLAPFGGFKQSGHGRELGPYGLSEFQELKAVQLP